MGCQLFWNIELRLSTLLSNYNKGTFSLLMFCAHLYLFQSINNNGGEGVQHSNSQRIAAEVTHFTRLKLFQHLHWVLHDLTRQPLDFLKHNTQPSLNVDVFHMNIVFQLKCIHIVISLTFPCFLPAALLRCLKCLVRSPVPITCCVSTLRRRSVGRGWWWAALSSTHQATKSTLDMCSPNICESTRMPSHKQALC